MDAVNVSLNQLEAAPSAHQSSTGRGVKILASTAVALALLVAATFATRYPFPSSVEAETAPPPALPTVIVSTPLQRDIEGRLGFLGQFSPVKRVELRAQVGGTLTEIGFKDGDVVKQGDLLFAIDPVPYEIKLSQAQAQLHSANARLTLTARQLDRREAL
ncbi:efflux RND transporter periplasmic adaptor subunit, partial [Singulisphaera rosea]